MNRRVGYLLCVGIVLGVCGVLAGQQKASAPDPADGALAVDAGMPLLRWTPAPGTVLANVYLSTAPDLGADDLVGPSVNMPMYYHMAGLTPGTTYYWRVDAIVPGGGLIEGDVWMFVTQALTAYYPTPADEGTSTTLTPDLTWLPGQGTVKHHVYFSDNEAAVVEGAAEADKGIVDDPNYAPGPLQSVTTYYWRVDEVKAGDVEVAGELWSFTTVLLIDDFESYTNEVGERIFEVWVDGIGFTQPDPGHPGNGTGAAVGHDILSPGTTYETWVETVVVSSGGQSMPLYYNNVALPYYSEAERTWSVAQDWTAGGLNTLTVHVQGLATDFVIPRVSPPPVIDGEVDDVWSLASIQELTIPLEGEPSGPEDSSGNFRVVYDDENLYLLADVTDESLINDTAETWQDDSVEFYFDGDNTKGPAGLSGNARQLTFGWTTEDVQGTNINAEGFELGQVDTASGWRLEVKMPWQSLMGTAAPVGRLIGVDCFINDDDDGDARDTQIAWHATEGVGWQTPSMWGTGLVAEAAAPDAADQLYVVLEDAFTRTATVTHPDPGVLKTTAWAPWHIVLSEFTDIDLTSIMKMYIGVGDRAATAPGAAGVLFVDDVYVSEAVLPEEPNEVPE